MDRGHANSAAVSAALLRRVDVELRYEEGTMALWRGTNPSGDGV